MNKYLLIVEKVSDADRAEVIMNFKGIEFKRHGMTMYDIWADEIHRNELNKFEWMSCIRVA